MRSTGKSPSGRLPDWPEGAELVKGCKCLQNSEGGEQAMTETTKSRRGVLACGTLSYRQEPLERALEGIARAGFPGVEIGCVSGYCEHLRPEQMSKADMQAAGKLVQGFGLWITSIAGHIDLDFPLIGKGPQAAAEGYSRLRARIDLAGELGVPIVNTGLGVARPGESLEEFYRELDKLLDYAASRNVTIGLESHAGLTETAKLSLDLCRKMDRPNLGINHDAGNVRFYAGVDPVADLAGVADQIAPYLVHVHIKDHRGVKGDWDFPPLGEGSIDLAGLAALYRRIGFAGPFSLEIEFKGPDSRDPAAQIIDQGVAHSYRFMQQLHLVEPAEG
jgi:sugar phosphate isomerase/epimerase